MIVPRVDWAIESLDNNVNWQCEENYGQFLVLCEKSWWTFSRRDGWVRRGIPLDRGCNRGWSSNRVLTTRCCLVKGINSTQNVWRTIQQLFHSSELFSLFLKSHIYMVCQGQVIFLAMFNHKSHLKHPSSSLCQSALRSTEFDSTVSQKFNRSVDSRNNHSTLGSGIQVLLPIAMVQACFDPDVAHPITDIRLYPYKGGGGVNYMQRIVFWTSRILLHLVKPGTPHLRPGKEY